MQQKFCIDEKFLNGSLFVPGRPRYGIASNLNIHFLPDFMQFIKEILTEDEALCLVDYELECLLMELATIRSMEIQECRSVAQLREHVLELIRKSASFWVRNSTIWNRIEGHAEQHQKQSLRAIEMYLEEAAIIGEKEKEELEQPLVEFAVKRERMVTQNYDKFNRFALGKQYMRLSVAMLSALKKYMLGLRNCEQAKTEYFLLDLTITEQKLKRRKKNIAAEQIQILNETSAAFVRFMGLEAFATAIVDESETDQTVIVNVIHCFLNLVSDKNHENGTAISVSFEELIKSINEEVWEEDTVKQVVCGWQQNYSQQKHHLQTIEVLEKQPVILEYPIPGCHNTAAEIEEIHRAWQGMRENPHFKKLSQYKFHNGTAAEWTPEDYKKLLQGLLIHFDQSVNNRKIAQFISTELDSNHVKHIKGTYLRNLKQRMQNGECGGGEFGECRSKKDFIQRDLDNFNVKWFAKGRKPAKRRKRLADSDEEVESSWECR